MNNNTYLIPANAKKSMLIFGLFNTIDLIIFGCGVGLSLILLPLLPVQKMGYAMIALAPASVAFFLVFHIPNYHNTLRFLKSLIDYLLNRQKFVWKGWCCRDGEEGQK